MHTSESLLETLTNSCISISHIAKTQSLRNDESSYCETQTVLINENYSSKYTNLRRTTGGLRQYNPRRSIAISNYISRHRICPQFLPGITRNRMNFPFIHSSCSPTHIGKKQTNNSIKSLKKNSPNCRKKKSKIMDQLFKKHEEQKWRSPRNRTCKSNNPPQPQLETPNSMKRSTD